MAKSISYRRVVGGEEARPTLADVQEQYLPSVLAQKSPSLQLHCNAEWRKPIGYAQSYVALGSGDGWWKEETDPGVRGNRPVTGECITTGQRFGTKLVRALGYCCSMIPRSLKIQTTRRRATCGAIRCYEKAGLRARYRNHPRWSSVHGSNTLHSSEHAVA